MDTCNSLHPTVSVNTYAGGTTSFDLLIDTTKTVTLPTLSITPVGCSFIYTMAVFRTNDNKNMVSELPTVFAISTPNLVLSHTPSNVA